MANRCAPTGEKIPHYSAHILAMDIQDFDPERSLHIIMRARSARKLALSDISRLKDAT